MTQLKSRAQGVRKMKAVSPLIATVLLIAFTIAVGGLISIWLTGFTQTQTQSVGTQASTSIVCSNGGLSLSSVGFCNLYLSGKISNSGTVSLGNISIIVTYTNASLVQKFCFTVAGSTIGTISSPCAGNLSLMPSELTTFNFTIGGSNFDTIKILSNCSGVTASVDSGSVSRTC
jgi:flagellin-like protein